MKKITLLVVLFTSFAFITKAQVAMTCNKFCVLSITIDTVGANSLNVTISSGDTASVNYPSVMVVNSAGDTVGNKMNLFFIFQQPGNATVTHNIPTTLDTLPSPFTGTVYFTDNSSHQVCSYSYPMTCTVGINEAVTENNTLNIFPNPASNQLSVVSSRLSVKEIKIYNLLGEGVYQSAIKQSNNLTIDISNFEKGIYFVQILTEEGMVSRKIIKQ